MATDYLSALNVGSGLNTTQIIDAIVAAEQEPQEALVNSQREEANVSISSFGTVKQNFTDFKNTMSALDGVTGMSISHSGSSVSATTTDNAKVTDLLFHLVHADDTQSCTTERALPALPLSLSLSLFCVCACVCSLSLSSACA